MSKTRTHRMDHTDSGARERLLEGLPVAERRLQLNGISTAVLEGGEGPPVVLLHGPGGYGASWWPAIPDLVAAHHVIAPDLPGHGATDGIGGELDQERMFGWLDDLIECTCPTPAALVGHALGGAIAARFASARGEQISRLVLVDSLGLAAFQPTPDFARALTEFLASPTEETHDHLWSFCAFDLDAMRHRIGERWDWIKSYNLDRARVPVLQAVQHSLMEQFGLPAIPQEELARITVPTSLIWGRQDRATALSVAETASARHGWPLHVIEHAADDPVLEQPEAFLEALRDALSTARTATPARGPQDTRAAWDRIAPGYDRTVTRTHMWLGNEGLRRAGLRKGMRFLDIAAGSGALSIPAARLGARVLAIDQSPVMLDLLKARARKEGLDIQSDTMDGHALQLPDNSFDLVGSQFGVMLFPDMPKGIREMARVAKRGGGRVLVHAYGDPHQIDFLGFFIAAVRSVRPDFNGPPADHPPLEFQLADPDRLQNELAAAGLGHVTVETITETMDFESGEALWEWIVSSNPIVENMLRSLDLTSEETGLIKVALEQMVRERAGGGGPAELTSPINIGIGMK